MTTPPRHPLLGRAVPPLRVLVPAAALLVALVAVGGKPVVGHDCFGTVRYRVVRGSPGGREHIGKIIRVDPGGDLVA